VNFSLVEKIIGLYDNRNHVQKDSDKVIDCFENFGLVWNRLCETMIDSGGSAITAPAVSGAACIELHPDFRCNAMAFMFDILYIYDGKDINHIPLVIRRRFIALSSMCTPHGLDPLAIREYFVLHAKDVGSGALYFQQVYTKFTDQITEESDTGVAYPDLSPEITTTTMNFILQMEWMLHERNYDEIKIIYSSEFSTLISRIHTLRRIDMDIIYLRRLVRVIFHDAANLSRILQNHGADVSSRSSFDEPLFEKHIACLIGFWDVLCAEYIQATNPVDFVQNAKDIDDLMLDLGLDGEG